MNVFFFKRTHRHATPPKNMKMDTWTIDLKLTASAPLTPRHTTAAVERLLPATHRRASIPPCKGLKWPPVSKKLHLVAGHGSRGDASQRIMPERHDRRGNNNFADDYNRQDCSHPPLTNETSLNRNKQKGSRKTKTRSSTMVRNQKQKDKNVLFLGESTDRARARYPRLLHKTTRLAYDRKPSANQKHPETGL